MPISSNRVKQWILETVARIANIPAGDLQPDVLIRDELGIDSLKAMEIVATCEKEMQVTIDERLLYEVRTVGDFINLLEGIYTKK